MKRRATNSLKHIASIAAIVAILVSAMLGSIAMQITVPVFADDTGWRSPSANINNGWTNPQRVYVSDNSRAAADDDNDIVQYYNFSIPAIPAGSTITGIEVWIEGYQNGILDSRQADVSLSWNNGVSYSSAKRTALPGSEGVRTYGSSSDTWGRTWSSNDFTNSNFKLKLDATSAGLDWFVYYLWVDHIQVKVHYKPGTTTVVSSSQNPSTYGQSVTFTATVTRTGGTNTPTGTVNFKDSAATIGTGTLSGSGGTATATFTTSSLAAGSHSITGTYVGDGNFNGSTSTVLTQTVNKANQTITFNALPTKTVGDPDFAPGATASSVLTVSYSSSNSSVATIVSGNIHIVGAGTSTITASQPGDSNYNAAAPVGQILTVNPQISIEITAPADISSWTASPAGGGENTISGNLIINVTPDGTSWTAIAKDTDAATAGYLTQWSGSYGTAKLANAMRVQGPTGEVTLPGGGAIASGAVDTTVTITFKQKVEWTDAPGDYRIVVTFIGAVVP